MGHQLSVPDVPNVLAEICAQRKGDVCDPSRRRQQMDMFCAKFGYPQPYADGEAMGVKLSAAATITPGDGSMVARASATTTGSRKRSTVASKLSKLTSEVWHTYDDADDDSEEELISQMQSDARMSALHILRSTINVEDLMEGILEYAQQRDAVRAASSDGGIAGEQPVADVQSVLDRAIHAALSGAQVAKATVERMAPMDEAALAAELQEAMAAKLRSRPSFGRLATGAELGGDEAARLFAVPIARRVLQASTSSLPKPSQGELSAAVVETVLDKKIAECAMDLLRSEVANGTPVDEDMVMQVAVVAMSDKGVCEAVTRRLTKIMGGGDDATNDQAFFGDLLTNALVERVVAAASAGQALDFSLLELQLTEALLVKFAAVLAKEHLEDCDLSRARQADFVATVCHVVRDRVVNRLLADALAEAAAPGGRRPIDRKLVNDLMRECLAEAQAVEYIVQAAETLDSLLDADEAPEDCVEKGLENMVAKAVMRALAATASGAEPPKTVFEKLAMKATLEWRAADTIVQRSPKSMALNARR